MTKQKISKKVTHKKATKAANQKSKTKIKAENDNRNKHSVTHEGKNNFSSGDFVVYPAHGVGQVVGTEKHDFCGNVISFYVIRFPEERMTLKVPVDKAKASGLRRLSSKDRIKTAIETLNGKSKIRRIMWSRRAQEYEAKINSGDPVAIAEVVRDLYRGDAQPEQSYSERQIYQFAIERLARELAAVEKTDEETAVKKLEEYLAKSTSKRKAAAA